jgi:hypothetical protein
MNARQFEGPEQAAAKAWDLLTSPWQPLSSR